MIEVKELEEKPRQVFPLARKDLNSDLVVLFTDPTTGVVVSGGKTNDLGEYEDNWTSCFDVSEWVPVEVTIKDTP